MLRRERSGRVGGVALLVAATLLAGVAGAVVGSVLAPEPSAPPAAEPEPRIGLRSGVVRLALPAGWEPLGRRSALPGFEQATAVRAGRSEIALDLRAPEHPSLLPAQVAAAGELPAPRLRELGARTVWRYDLPGERVVAMVLPTTGGILTIACGRSAQTGAECEHAVRTVWVEGASVLRPAPEAAAAIALPDIVARLNRVRRDERRRLAATPWPAPRARASQRLARAYAGAAAGLRPLAAGEAAAVTATLAELARAHDALAAANRSRAARRAGGRRAARAARRATARIVRGERRLAAQLAPASPR
jgi:hypothetical protein